jgi:hypothetical protein
MFGAFREEPSDKLGELIVCAGLVPSADVVEALQVAKKLRIPLGRVLLAAECISKPYLDAALDAQKLVRQGLSSVTASCALALMADENISFSEAREKAVALVDTVESHPSGNIFD